MNKNLDLNKEGIEKEVWESVFSCRESVFCRDPWGNTMAKEDFNKETKYGWIIDFLDSNNNNTNIENLQPIHWKTKQIRENKIYKKWSRI